MNLFLIVLGVLSVSMVAMAVGIIIRNRGFSSCGRAAADALEGGSGTCSVCGQGAAGECKRKKSD